MRLRWSVMASSRLSRNMRASPWRSLYGMETQSPCPDARRGPNRLGRPRGPVRSHRGDAMSPRAHAGRGVAATLALVGAIMLGLSGPAPAARSDPHDGDAPASIDSAEVISAWLTLRRWVNEFSLPAPEGTAARIPLANAAGACVILRQAGRVVGTGVDASAGDYRGTLTVSAKGIEPVQAPIELHVADWTVPPPAAHRPGRPAGPAAWRGPA